MKKVVGVKTEKKMPQKLKAGGMAKKDKKMAKKAPQYI